MSLLTRLEVALAPRVSNAAQKKQAAEPVGGSGPSPSQPFMLAPLAEAQPLPGFSGAIVNGLNWLDGTIGRLRYKPLSADEPVGGSAPEPTGGAAAPASGLIDTPLKELIMKPLRLVAKAFDGISSMLGFPPSGSTATPAPKPSTPAPKPTTPAPAPKPAAPKTVTVQKGDTLSGIAKRTLGDANRWREIYDLNRDQISNPNLIYAGQVLKLPGGANVSAPAPAPAPAPSSGKQGNFPLSAAQIASVLGANSGNVAKYWPAIYEAFRKRGMADTPTLIAALATIKVEVGASFAPIPEYASGAAYEGRKDLGNTHPGDGVRYKGRGFIQLTGRANYTTYGNKFGVDLVGNPDLALSPTIAAEVLAQYFQDRNIDDAARAGDWETVRRRVNGGTNGWSTFIGAVNALKKAT